MNKSEKNARKQIEILKAQFANQKSKQVKNGVGIISGINNLSSSDEIAIDPKFYRTSLIKTMNLTFILISALLLLYVFQDKWFGYINLNF